MRRTPVTLTKPSKDNCIIYYIISCSNRQSVSFRRRCKFFSEPSRRYRNTAVSADGYIGRTLCRAENSAECLPVFSLSKAISRISSPDHRKQVRLGDHRNAEGLRFRQLASGSFARQQIIRLLRDASADFAAVFSMRAAAAFRSMDGVYR